MTKLIMWVEMSLWFTHSAALSLIYSCGDALLLFFGLARLLSENNSQFDVGNY